MKGRKGLGEKYQESEGDKEKELSELSELKESSEWGVKLRHPTA